MTAWHTFRLAAWREARTRWWVHLVAPGLALAHFVLYVRLDLTSFFAGFIVPMAALVATRGAGPADAFWRGLGGPGWARVAGSAVVSLPPLAAAWAVNQAPSVGWMGVLWGAVTVARTFVAGPALLAAPLIALVAAGFVGILLPGSWEFLAVPGALALAMVAEGRVGVWTFRVRPSLRWGLASALLAPPFVGVGLLFTLPRTSLQVVSDGEVLIQRRSAWRGLRVAVWRDGEERQVEAAGSRDAWLGPAGSVLLEFPEEVVLVSAAGDRSACVWERVKGAAPSWRADGRAVLVDTPTGLVEVADGCRSLDGLHQPGWLGDEPVGVRGDVLVVGEREVTFPHGILDVASVGGHVWVNSNDELYEVTSVGTERVATEVRGLGTMGGAAYTHVDGETRWWTGGSRETCFDGHVGWSFGRRDGHLVDCSGATRAELETGKAFALAVRPDGTLVIADHDTLRLVKPSGETRTVEF